MASIVVSDAAKYRVRLPRVCCPTANMPRPVGPAPKIGFGLPPIEVVQDVAFFRPIQMSVTPKSDYLMMLHVLINQIQIRFTIFS